MVLHFDPTLPVVEPRDAATVLLLRAAPSMEVFCVQRSPKSGFLGGAVVFPGGKVDEADLDEGFASRVRFEATARLMSMASSEAAARALSIAAARESVEEAGVLPTASGAEVIARIRSALGGGASFLSTLTEHDVHLDLEGLVPFGRWITPRAEQRRFDARFFLLAMPEGQVADPCMTETTMGFWATPEDVLARFERSEIMLAPPTTRCLEILREASDLDTAFALAARQSLLPVCPEFVPGDPPALVLPGDKDHSVRERRIDGPTRFVLKDGRFVSSD